MVGGDGWNECIAMTLVHGTLAQCRLSCGSHRLELDSFILGGASCDALTGAVLKQTAESENLITATMSVCNECSRNDSCLASEHSGAALGRAECDSNSRTECGQIGRNGHFRP